jgi:cell division protein FtsL
MMEPQQAERKEKSLAERLPKIGRVSQVILIVGIVAIIFIALYIMGNQMATEQDELRENITMSQRSISAGTEEAPRENLKAQIRQTEAETEAARAMFPAPEYLTEIMDGLMKLARSYDIEVTGTGVKLAQKKIKIGGEEVTYDVYTISLSLRGMASNFQNFLLSLDDAMATSRINQVTMKLAAAENERDEAAVSLDIYCYKSD